MRINTCFVVWVVVFCIMLAEAQEEKTKNSKFRWKRPTYAMPWLKGPNVCAIEQVIGSRKHYFSECTPYLTRQICGKNTFVRYHCCTGFEKEGDTEGCQGVAPVENLMLTAKNLYVKDFKKLAEKNQAISDRLINGGAYTVFAPENRAFNNLPPETRAKFNKKNPDRNLLSYHMADGRYYYDDMYHDQAIPTLYGKNDTLKINRYSNGIVTVNCARLIIPDQPATNGIIHVVEKVVEPIDKTTGTVMEKLLNNDDVGEFVTALILTDLSNQLRGSSDSFTIFAPTDQAFRNAPQELISRIFADNNLVEKLLKYHILDKSICTSAILGPISLHTLEGQKMNLSCDILDRLTVNNIPMSDKDNAAYNGVIHTIDTLLIPDSVKSLDEKVTEMGLNEFKRYAQDGGIYDNIMAQTSANYTILAPNDEAFASLTHEQKRMLRSSSQAVRRLVNYHVIPGHVTTREIVGDTNLMTSEYSTTVNAYSSAKVYNKQFGINSARIISKDNVVANGVIHVTDQVLWPPEGVLMDRIQEDSELKTFMSFLQMSGLDALLLEDKQYTVFAPTDDAFEAMETSVLEQLMVADEDLELFVKNHIIESPTYMRTLEDKWRYRYKTMADDWIEVKRKSHGTQEIINESVKVIKKDVMATNGVLHKVDTAFSCTCLDRFQNTISIL